MPPEPEGSFSCRLSAAFAAPQSSGVLLPILLLILLIIISAFFTAGSCSISAINADKLKKAAKSGEQATAKAVKSISDSGRFLAAMRAGVTFLGFLTAAAVSRAFSGRLAGALAFLPMPANLRYGISAVIIILLLTYVTLLFGQAIPERLAARQSGGNPAKLVGFISGSSTVFRPLAALLSVSADALLHLFGFNQDVSRQALTKSEILRFAGIKDNDDVLSESAKEMISNILEFSGRTADEVMTHRTEVGAVEDTDSVRDTVALSMEKGYSRIPVFKEDLDNILGIIYIKDLLKYIGNPLGENVKLTGLMRPAYFVPESKLCSEIFSEMTARKIQIAIVVDEYGGTEGILTMEDLLESIVGSIQDEYDNEEEEVCRVDENRFNVDGGASIDEISDLTGVELPQGNYDTIAGLIMEKLGRIPKPGDHPRVQIKGLAFTVTEMDDRRIARILIEKEFPAEHEEN